MNDTGSFIPRQKTAPKRHIHRRIYVLSYLVYALFFGSLLTVGGLLVWEWQLESAFAAKKEQLNQERSQFNQSDIERVRELDVQLQHVHMLLDQQPAISKIFSALEVSTLQSIQIQEFTLTESLEAGNQYDITFRGATDNFDAVLFQRDVFRDNDLLADAEVIDITYGASGEDIDDLITYRVHITLPFSSIPFTNEFALLASPVQTGSAVVSTDSTVPAVVDSVSATGSAPVTNNETNN